MTREQMNTNLLINLNVAAIQTNLLLLDIAKPRLNCTEYDDILHVIGEHGEHMASISKISKELDLSENGLDNE